MSGHTPGPWFISGTRTKYIEARIPGGMIQEVAACGPTAADNGYGPQQEGNARLMAAAPDLLEALEKLLEFWQPSGSPEEHDIQAEGYAAIARAKGEQP